jgi:hypothetical protein
MLSGGNPPPPSELQQYVVEQFIHEEFKSVDVKK